jgi:hypothetical protein
MAGGGLGVLEEGGELIAEDGGGGVDGGDSGGREGEGDEQLEAEESAFGLGVTEGVVIANLGCDMGEEVGVRSGTSPTGTVFRKCVRGTPRASTSGRSGSSSGCEAWGSER